jgi:hypothetical protein
MTVAFVIVADGFFWEVCPVSIIGVLSVLGLF